MGLESVISERLKHNFFGNYFLAFVLSNWNLFLIYFGNMRTVDKLKYVNDNLYLGSTFLWPLLFTVAYLGLSNLFSSAAYYLKTRLSSLADKIDHKANVNERSYKKEIDDLKKCVNSVRVCIENFASNSGQAFEEIENFTVYKNIASKAVMAKSSSEDAIAQIRDIEQKLSKLFKDDILNKKI